MAHSAYLFGVTQIIKIICFCSAKTKQLPKRRVDTTFISPFPPKADRLGLDGAPYSFEQVAGESVS